MSQTVRMGVGEVMLLRQQREEARADVCELIARIEAVTSDRGQGQQRDVAALKAFVRSRKALRWQAWLHWLRARSA